MTRTKSLLLAALGAAIAGWGTARAWETLSPRVVATPYEYTISGGKLHVNGQPTHTEAMLVGLCENGSAWVLQRLRYGSKPWRWGLIVPGDNFYEDPLLNTHAVTINWRAAPLPEC